MKLLIFRSTWGLVNDSDGEKALVSQFSTVLSAFTIQFSFFKSPHKTLDTALPALAELGYDGIEIPLKAIYQFGAEKFKDLLKECNLKVIIMVFTDGPVAPGAGLVFGGPYPGFTTPSEPGERDKNKLVETHLKVFKEQVVAAQAFKPYFVNSHSCKDYFTFQMAQQFFTNAVDWAKSKGY